MVGTDVTVAHPKTGICSKLIVDTHTHTQRSQRIINASGRKYCTVVSPAIVLGLHYPLASRIDRKTNGRYCGGVYVHGVNAFSIVPILSRVSVLLRDDILVFVWIRFQCTDSAFLSVLFCFTFDEGWHSTAKLTLHLVHFIGCDRYAVTALSVPSVGSLRSCE